MIMTAALASWQAGRVARAAVASGTVNTLKPPVVQLLRALCCASSRGDPASNHLQFTSHCLHGRVPLNPGSQRLLPSGGR
jgi:hypothetical protein